MAMTTCRECDKQVSTEAKVCPHCGTDRPAKKKAKSGKGKWLLIFIAIGLAAAIVGPKREGKSAASNTVAKPAAAPVPAPVVVKAPAEPNLDDYCFNSGASLAKVFLGNFAQSADVGLMASEVMEQGCTKNVGDKGDACVRQCKTGFKIEAKDAIKGLPR